MRKKQEESKWRNREHDESSFYVCRYALFDFLFHAMTSSVAAKRLAKELEERISTKGKRKYYGSPEARRFIKQAVKYLRGPRGLF